MKRSDINFIEEYIKQFEEELLFKNIIKFSKKFQIGVCSIGVADWQYSLLKEDFERLYPNLNFEEEWKKVVEE